MSRSTRNWFRNVSLRLESFEKRENPAPIVPVYNSNPGVFAQLYLDFDGNTGPSGWCGTSGSITTTVFGTDGDPNNYSASELTLIDQIWKRIAEDYTPFNINVTTVLPSDFNDKHAVRLAIGGQSGGIGWSGVGGVGCLASFYSGGSSNNIAFVHSPNLSNNAKYVAMATSHEAGHTFNLGHQDNPPCGGYHGGSTYNGESKGPIMGAPYNATRELWWQGFEGCGTQNDMTIISNASNGFGYRADDISNSKDGARRLRNNSGVLAGSLTGVIHQTTDQDWFAFTSPAGTANITISVAALGPNLDTEVELWSDNGGSPVLLATAGGGGNNVFTSTINFNVPSGKKYIVVKSDGDYGEVGAYSVSGTVPSGSLLPGIDDGDSLSQVDTHPLSPLFTGEDNTDYSKLPPPAGCGCASCVAAAAMARAGDQRLALATMAVENTSAVATSNTSHPDTSADVPQISGVTENTTKSSTGAKVIHRVLTGATPIDPLAHDPLGLGL